MGRPVAYSPAYFRKLAGYYQHFAETAREFRIPVLVCSKLEMAAIQFRCAAQAIENAQKGKK